MRPIWVGMWYEGWKVKIIVSEFMDTSSILRKAGELGHQSVMSTACQEDVCQVYGCRYPIFGLSHSSNVAAAVTLAGGVGVWAAARLLPDEITAGIEKIRANVGDLQFGVNLMLPRGVPEFADRVQLEQELPQGHVDFVSRIYDKYGVPRDDELGERNRIVRSEELFMAQVEATLAGSGDLFAIAIGSRPEIAARAKAAGKRIVALVGSPRHIAHANAMEADLIVAQGADAGGHIGAVGTFTLVPSIVDRAGGRPVLAAGGIGTGRQIVAAHSLGAAGVWLGTLWLASTEFGLEENLFERMVLATCEDTVVTRASSGKAMRQLRSEWAKEWAQPGAPEPLPMPWQDMLVGSLEGAVQRHRIEPLMTTPAGQSVEWVRERVSVSEIIARLVAEARAAAINPMPRWLV